MAKITETLVLVDQFSRSFSSYLRQSRMARAATSQTTQAAKMSGQEYKNLSAALAEASSSAGKTTRRQRDLNDAQKNGQAAANGLTGAIKRLVGAFVGVQGLRTLAGLSDSLSSTRSRLTQVAQELGTVGDFNEQVYQSAMRSGAAYQEMASFIAQVGSMAGDAFSSGEELVAFAEQINKQLTISGATGESASAALFQLSQALSSGVLRGDELNSVMEQTPIITQTIAKYLGVSNGQLREMASEGQITADVIKNAMFAATEETNARFEEMPLTWSRVINKAKNLGIQLFSPLINGFGLLAEKADQALTWMSENEDMVVAGLAGIGTAAAILGVKMAASGLAAAAAWAVPLLPIIAIGAAITAAIVLARKAGADFADIGAFVGGVFGTLYAYAMNQCIVPLQNGFAMFANFFGNVFQDPVAAVKVLIYDMALTCLGYVQSLAQGIENLVNKIPGVSVDLTSGLTAFVNENLRQRQSVIESSGWKEYVKAWDYVDYSQAAASGMQLGARLGAKVDGFDLGGAISSALDGSAFLGGGNPLQDIAGNVDEIKGNTGSIAKSVNMANEDLQSFVDVATRRYVNRINLTSQTPVIHVTGQNTGSTQADAEALARKIAQIIVRQAAAASARPTAAPQ